MQTILGIDLSTEPASFQVVQVNGRSVSITASQTVPLAGVFTDGRAAQVFAATPEEHEAQEQPEQATSSQTNSENSATQTATDTTGLNGAPEPYIQKFKETLASLGGGWTTAVVIVPCQNYLSLNLELPFQDPKQIEKIIDLEVQDRIPFDVNEFLVEHRVIGKVPSNAHDIHVSLSPKPNIRAVVTLCRAAGLEPVVVSTPQSALGSLLHLAPDYFAGNIALLLQQDPYYYLAVRIDNQVRLDRVIVRLENEDEPSAQFRAVINQIKMTLCHAESRYQSSIDKLYVLGETIGSRELQQLLGRPVEELSLAEFISGETSQLSLAALAAPFGQDIAPPLALTNFRTREFSYNLQLGEVINGIYKLLPYFVALLICSALFIAGRYYLNDRRISAMEQAMQIQAQQTIPEIALSPGTSIADTLQEQINKIDRELEGLGSPSKYTPLDILAEITTLMPNKPGVMFRNVTIRGSRIKLNGNAPEVSDVEAIGRALRNSQKIRFRVSEPQFSDSRFGSGTGKEFSFDLALRE